MADNYFTFLLETNERNKNIKKEIEAKVTRLDKGMELIREDCDRCVSTFEDSRKRLEGKFSLYKFREDRLEDKANLIENELLKKLNKPFIGADLIRTRKKINKMQSLKMMNLNNNHVENKEKLTSYNKEMGMNIFERFHIQFAKLLHKNFKTYKFRRNWDKFVKRIHKTKKLMNVFSQALIRKFYFLLIKKIHFLTKMIKGYLLKNKLLYIYHQTKSVLLLKRKFTIKSLTNQVTNLKNFKKKIKLKIYSKINSVRYSIRYKLDQFNDNRILLAVKFSEYQTKYKALLGFIVLL